MSGGGREREREREIILIINRKPQRKKEVDSCVYSPDCTTEYETSQ